MDEVALEHVAKATGEVLAAVEGAMGAFAHPAGIGVVNEAALEDRLDDVDQGVVHHPVAKRGGGDDARFRIADGEVEVRPRAVGLSAQLSL
jgi:hypothetical protein